MSLTAVLVLGIGLTISVLVVVASYALRKPKPPRTSLPPPSQEKTKLVEQKKKPTILSDNGGTSSIKTKNQAAKSSPSITLAPRVDEKTEWFLKIRSGIPLQDTVPTGQQSVFELDDLSVLLKNYRQWKIDSMGLQSLCQMLIQCLEYCMHHAHETNVHVNRYYHMIEQFIERYDAEMRKLASSKKPFWGKDWFPFSITSTILLAYYLLLPLDSRLKQRQIAAKLILYIIPNPNQSLLYPRSNIYSIAMAGPWLVAHNELNTLPEARKNIAFLKTIDYLKFNIVENMKDEGLHRDMSYYAHNLIFSPGILLGIDSPLLQTILVTSPSEDYRILFGKLLRLKEILHHPTIPRTLLGCNNRSDSLLGLTSKSSPLGIKVLPISKFLRYYTERFYFAVRGQCHWLGFYESDIVHNANAQYWVQYRSRQSIFTPASTRSIHNRGFIQKASTTKAKIFMPESTSQIYFPKSAKSFVMQYKQYGLCYQEYTIPEFGNYTVTELIRIDSNTEIIVLTVRIENRETEALYYYMDTTKESAITLPPGKTTILEITLADLEKTNIIQSFPLYDKQHSLPLSATTNAFNIRLINDNFHVLIDEKNHPILLTFYSIDKETDRITATVDNARITFAFNVRHNQYMSLDADV